MAERREYSPPVVAGWRTLWFAVMQRPVEDIRRVKAAYFAAVDRGCGPVEAADEAQRVATQ